MNNFDGFINIMEENLKYKKAILNYIPIDQSLRILDYGCGSGVLTEYIASQRPDCVVCGYDFDMEMVKLARKRCGDSFFTGPDCELIEHSFDIVVLSSVLHEVEDKEAFLKQIGFLISRKSGSKIIIRDGFIESEKENQPVSIALKNPLEATFFHALAGDSKIGNLPIEIRQNLLTGRQRDVRNFLQTYTWGFDSLFREKNELHLISDAEYKAFGEMLDCAKVTINTICQEAYFEHLQKIIKIRSKWTTHAIVVYEW